MPTDLPVKREVKHEPTPAHRFVSAMFGMAIVVFVFYLLGSFAVSIGKKAAGDCGERWHIETVISGDWFCPMTQAQPRD